MPHVHIQTIIDNRYQIEEQLGRGGMGIVYRAYDRLSARQVALKQVLFDGAQSLAQDAVDMAADLDLPPTDDELPSESISASVALGREFQMLGRLRHPYIISVLDYGFHRRQPYFTMTLLQAPRDICTAAHGQEIAVQFRLLTQMLLALAYLHRRGIVHRDLKPGNVLVDQEGNVKVVDFGLALEREQVQATVGTLAYMAPEVLRGEGAQPASDLYAAGVLIFELLAGRHPYSSDDVSDLIRQTLAQPPDLSPLPSAVQSVVARLLAKAPHDRFPTALEALRALSASLGQPLPPESEEIRDSFLQAAAFVGRESELAHLSEALDRTLQGQGSAWLVGGESGVGKTRLLDELRIRAVVQGAFTLRGQANREGGAPYQTWRDVLRRLCLQTSLRPLEAGVLKPFVPDIERLLQRDVPDAPELDAEATHRRLLGVVEAILRRQERPLVLVLEDMQWATAGLSLLRHLVLRLADRPVLIVASYRDDEAPDLPKRLPTMQPLTLQRFDPDTVAALSASMLGEDTGRHPQIISLLVRETEGNVFFLVEVIRALAEEAGRLENVASMTLPQHVFAAGIAAIVQRRLNRVPAQAQPLLRLAAVGGRRLDLDLLRAAEPQIDLEEWLARCSDAAVLEIRSEGWQFAHDKLREALLDDLAPDEARRLHRRMAHTIEAVYPQNDLYAVALANHWAQAGDRDRELHYRTVAGRLALDNGANREALQLLQQALELAQTRQYESLTLAHLNRLLGEAYMGLGDLTQSRAAFLQTLHILQAPFPDQSLQLGLRLGLGLAKQLLYRALQAVRPLRPVSGARERRRYREKMHAYRQLGEITFLVNESIPTSFATIHAMNVAERLPPGPEQAILYANMCVVAGLISWHRLAKIYKRRALQTLQSLPRHDPWAAGNVYLALSVYVTSLGIWRDAEPDCRLALQEAEASGDYRLRGGGLNILGTAQFNQGYVTESLDLFRQLRLLGRDSGNRMHEGWGVVNQVACLLRLEHAHQDALPMLQESLSIQHEVQDKVAELNTYALLALLYHRQERREKALQAAQNAIPLLSGNATSLGSYEGFHDVPTVLLDLWESGFAKAEAPAREACKRLTTYARFFRFARPINHICQGRLHRMEGYEDHARRAFKSAIKEARFCGMPYEEAMAQAWLGIGD